MRRPALDEITVTFDPFSFSPFMGSPFMGRHPWGGELARVMFDAQLHLTQAVLRAAWEAQAGFLRAAGAAVLDAQARVAGSLLRPGR